MLHEADIAVVARDTALRGLGLLLDAERFAGMLRALRPGEAWCEAVPSYLRYKPGTSCVAAFRLSCGNGATVEVVAKALTRARFAEARAHPKGPGRAGAPWPLDEAAVLVMTPAHDRSLKVLRRLADPARRDKLLRRLLPGAVPDAIEPLRYKPERRFVARLVREGAPQAVLRAYPGEDFDVARSGALLAAAAFGGPRLLGMLPEHRVTATAWIPGTPLCPELNGVPSHQRSRQLGALLARLHGTAIVHPRQRTRAVEARALGRLAEDLALLCPGLGEQAGRLAAELASELASSSLKPAWIHGDLSLDQVVADGEQLHLIDWDESASGDPAADLGSLAARLELQVIDGTLTRGEADAVIDAVLDAYAQAAGSKPRGVGLQTVAALLRLATEPFRMRRPDWHERVQSLLDRAAVLRSRPAGRAADRVAKPAAQGCGAALLERSLDAAAMRPLIARCLGGADAATLELEAVRLVRHKPGRRWLIEYSVASPAHGCFAVLGKGRAKGLDRRAFEVQQALWWQGFDAAEPVSVPEPLGLLPELELWLQRKEPGVPAAAGFTPQADGRLAHRVAQALARLHRAGVPSTRRWTLTDELDLLRTRLHDAAELRPELAPRIERLALDCAALAECVPSGASTGIHRDFHPEQVLVDGERLVLLDLDLYCIGDPALDAGNFIAHLTELALRLHGDAGALAHHEHALAEGFLALSPRVSRTALQAWATLSLARHVFLSTQYPERRHTTGALLDVCEARVAQVAATC